MRRPAVLTRGFSLIEMLVVLVIIGVLVTVMGISFTRGSVEEKLQIEAQRLQQIFKLAGEDAEAKGIQIGFRYTREGYEFLAINSEGQWDVIADSSPLRAREFSGPFEIQLMVEGRAVAPAVGREFQPDEPIEPQILLLSSGELTPFMLHFAIQRQPDSGHILEGDLLGEITLAPWNREAWRGSGQRQKAVS